jgi:hypothetical protein
VCERSAQVQRWLVLALPALLALRYTASAAQHSLYVRQRVALMQFGHQLTGHTAGTTVRKLMLTLLLTLLLLCCHYTQARMWLAGGGYIGTKGNNVVENMICK